MQPAFDPMESKYVLKNTLRFLNDYLQYPKLNLTENPIKACHTLPVVATNKQFDSVI